MPLPDIERVTVVGGGTMGLGIAQVAAAAGMTAILHDISSAALDRAMKLIQENLDKGVEKGKVTPAVREATLERIQLSDDLAHALSGSDLVIEAVPESLELKRRIFADLERLAPPQALLASNTSSLPVGEIADVVSNPARVGGMHFFNPVHIMPLLEVIRADTSATETVDALVRTGQRMGKECIVVRDSPGFATSRLGVVIGLEAMRMLEEGVASAEDIDKAMTLGYRHPLGPLRLTDLVGLDVRLAIAEHLHRTLGSEAFRPPELLRRKVAEGKLGKKTGEGFHRWD